MAEYIDKNKIIDKLSEEFDILIEEGNIPEGYLTALSLIETTQAEDVVSAVRCKDCIKHYTVHCTLYTGETRDDYGNSTCHYCGATARDDFFCPDGEAENESIPKHQKTTIDDSEYEDIKCNLKCDECSDRNYCDYPDLKEGIQWMN